LGQVSVALDQDLNREVALKEILSKHADNPISRERFLLEAEITGGLEHPGIVPVYALGHGPDGRPFYAMRFVKGDCLKQAIEDFHKPDNPNRKDPGGRRLALRQLLGRFIDVCNAMEYAHSRGVLHRDLKPGNIMVGKYGETLVVDWGLAKPLGKREIVSDEATLRPSSALSSSGQTVAGTPVGTPAYMSPEQAAGKLEELSPASDVYSLGATLYHLLCGRPPFAKDEYNEIVVKVQQGDFPRPRSVDREVPFPLEAICLKAMALKALDRYQTARALADDLEHWLADEPIVAAPNTLSDRVSRFSRKHRGYVRAGAVAVALVAVVSSVATLLINESRNDALSSAQRERNAKTTAQELAARNEVLANAQRTLAEEKTAIAANERAARLATEHQLRIATAERLAAQSSSAVQRGDPEVALLLAVESGHARLDCNEELLASSHQALIDALPWIGGRRLSPGRHNNWRDGFFNVAKSIDGRWTTVTSWGVANVREWQGAMSPADSLLIGSQGYIESSAMTPDGRWLVAGSTDKRVRVWDLSTDSPSAPLRTLTGHNGIINSVAVSADGRWVVTASLKLNQPNVDIYDNTIRIWDLQALNPTASQRILPGDQSETTAIAISADGHWLATGSFDKTARLWDLQALNSTATPHATINHEQSVDTVAITSNNRWLVSTAQQSVRISDLKTENPGAESRLLVDKTAKVAISQDGRWVVTASWGEYTGRVWDLASVDPARNARVLSGHQGQISCIAISADSRWVATGSEDKTVRIWELFAERSSDLPRVLRGHRAPINSVAISADSGWVVADSARLWNLTGAHPDVNPRFLIGGWVVADTSVDGRWFATAGGNIVNVWDLQSDDPAVNQYMLNETQGVISLALSSNGRWLVTGAIDKSAQVYDLWAEAASANPRTLIGHDGPVTGVAISDDGRWLVTASGAQVPLRGGLTFWEFNNYDGTVRIWDLHNEDPVASQYMLPGDQKATLDVAISASGHWLATRGSDKTARLWDLQALKSAASPFAVIEHDDRLIGVAITPDDRWLVSTDENLVKVSDLKADIPGTRSFVLDGQSGVRSMVISPDSYRVVTGSRSDGTVRIWDLQADDPAASPRILKVGGYSVPSVAISPDSRWIVTGSSEVRIWDLTGTNESASPRTLGGGGSTLERVAISPDSRWVLTQDGSGAHLWRWHWEDLITLAANVGRNFSREEWEQQFPGREYRKIFPQLPVTGDPRFASDYLVRGTKRFENRDYDNALSDFTEAIRLAPQNAQAYVSRAKTWDAKGDVDSALEDLAESIRLNPNSTEAYAQRAFIRHRGRQLDAALGDYEELIRIDPANAWALKNRAGIWQMKGDRGKALSDFTEVIRLDSNFVHAYAERSKIYLFWGDIENALSDLTQVIRLEPNDATAHNDRAWLYATVELKLFRDGRKAIADANKACELTAWRNWAFLDTLAAAHAEAGEFDEAVKWQLKALELCDEGQKLPLIQRLELYKAGNAYREYTSRLRGEALARNHDPAKAAVQFGRAHATDPNNLQIGQVLANLYAHTGELEKYRALCAELIDRFGDDPKSSLMLGWTLMLAAESIENMPRLIEFGKQAVATRPDAAWMHTALGGAYLRNGKYDLSLQSLDDADRLGKQWVARPLHDLMRAVTLLRMRRIPEGREALAKGVEFCDRQLTPSPDAAFGILSNGNWWDWYTFQIFRREAEELLRAAGDESKSP
jgi:WD40 repeat protein/serine/threonine protein kinase/tetratricopeptide (TPR) repeat protein